MLKKKIIQIINVPSESDNAASTSSLRSCTASLEASLIEPEDSSEGWSFSSWFLFSVSEDPLEDSSEARKSCIDSQLAFSS